MQKHRDRNGRCIAIFFKSVGVRGRLTLPLLRLEKGVYVLLAVSAAWFEASLLEIAGRSSKQRIVCLSLC